jgi:hypothetical protein
MITLIIGYGLCAWGGWLIGGSLYHVHKTPSVGSAAQIGVIIGAVIVAIGMGLVLL